MPVIHEPKTFSDWIDQAQADQKFIAHCDPGKKRKLSEMTDTSLSSHLIGIGPEGDFTGEE